MGENVKEDVKQKRRQETDGDPRRHNNPAGQTEAAGRGGSTKSEGTLMKQGRESHAAALLTNPAGALIYIGES